MNDIQFGEERIRAVESSTAGEDRRPTRVNHALGLGAVALGAFALGAIAIGALAIGRLAVGALALKRGRIQILTVENLEVRRLYIGESMPLNRK
jgi:hypothetical protein